MRIFFGLPVSEEFFEGLKSRVRESLTPSLTQHLHWTRPGQAHVTLRFIGEIKETQLVSLLSAMEVQKLEETKAFDLNFTLIDHFPAPTSRLLAAQAAATDSLKNLFSQVESAVRIVGFDPELRGIRPHITLCRGDKIRNASILPIFLEDYALLVNEVRLYKTILLKGGNEYETLQQFALQR